MLVVGVQVDGRSRAARAIVACGGDGAAAVWTVEVVVIVVVCALDRSMMMSC